LEPLIDHFGRRITYIRFSVTPHCNFDCIYCSSHISESAKSKEFNLDDIAFLFNTVSQLGIKKVRLTGGEPLIRKDITDIVKKLSVNKEIKEIVLTTNGSLLKYLAEPLKEAGLTRVNISLDSMRRDIFKKITKRDEFNNVIEGIKKSVEVGLVPIKVNAVLMRGINEEDVIPIVELSLHYPIIVRFIELMPVKGDNFWRDHYMPFSKALNVIREKYKLVKSEGANGEVADYYKVVGSEGKVGFITPVSQHFCSNCNRIRITASGKIYPCLFSEEYVDIWESVKAKRRNELVKLIKRSVEIKPKEHGPIELDDKIFIENMRELGG